MKMLQPRLQLQTAGLAQQTTALGPHAGGCNLHFRCSIAWLDTNLPSSSHYLSSRAPLKGLKTVSSASYTSIAAASAEKIVDSSRHGQHVRLKEEWDSVAVSRPVRIPVSEDQRQLPAHRRESLSQLHFQPAARTTSGHARAHATQQKSANSADKAESRKRKPQVTAAVTNAPVSTALDSFQYSNSGHAQLQPFWSALQDRLLHGKAFTCVRFNF